MSKFLSVWKDESGAAAAEYALILAIVGAGIAAAAVLLGNDIANGDHRRRGAHLSSHVLKTKQGGAPRRAADLLFGITIGPDHSGRAGDRRAGAGLHRLGA